MPSGNWDPVARPITLTTSGRRTKLASDGKGKPKSGHLLANTCMRR